MALLASWPGVSASAALGFEKVTACKPADHRDEEQEPPKLGLTLGAPGTACGTGIQIQDHQPHFVSDAEQMEEGRSKDTLPKYGVGELSALEGAHDPEHEQCGEGCIDHRADDRRTPEPKGACWERRAHREDGWMEYRSPRRSKWGKLNIGQLQFGSLKLVPSGSLRFSEGGGDDSSPLDS